MPCMHLICMHTLNQCMLTWDMGQQASSTLVATCRQKDM
jgi:hypothetical protein